MKVEKIKSVEIQDDGKSARLVFQGLSGTVSLTFGFDQLQQVIGSGIQATAAMQTNNRLPTPKKGEFEPMRDIIPVESIEFFFHDNGTLDLMIEGVEGTERRSVQVALTPLWVQNLREALSLDLSKEFDGTASPTGPVH